jgi:hypothetical protein
MTGAERLAAQVAVTPQARSIARDHVQWARRAGFAPCKVGAPFGRRTPTWEDVADCVALAWEDWCGPGSTTIS